MLPRQAHGGDFANLIVRPRNILTAVMIVVQISTIYCYKFYTQLFVHRFPSHATFLYCFFPPVFPFFKLLSLLYSSLLFWSWDSAVGVRTGLRCSIPGRGSIFSLLKRPTPNLIYRIANILYHYLFMSK